MIPLPDIRADRHTAVHGGDLVLLGYAATHRDDVLVWVGPDKVYTIPLDERPDDEAALPSLLAHPVGGVVVVRNLTHAVYFAGPDAPAVPLTIDGANLIANITPEPRIYGGSAVSDEARWHVVLSDRHLLADLRYAAPLAIDIGAGKATWETAPWILDTAEFPRDLAGLKDSDPVVSICTTLLCGGTLHACSAGSRIRSMVYGADFFSCVRVTPDGHVIDRIHEQSGWKSDTKKHGILAQFTVDGHYAVLSQVFQGDTWKGRQRILRLSDGELLTPKLPRGLTKAEILDHHPARGWWLRLNNQATVVPNLV